MRKILGILNVVAAIGILALIIWFFTTGFLPTDWQDPRSIVNLVIFLLGAVTSLTTGLLVLKKRGRILAILATVNLIFAGLLLLILSAVSLFFFRAFP